MKKNVKRLYRGIKLTMFTVEFESDASVITTLDQQGRFEDVEVVISDNNVVYLRQFDEELAEYQLLHMSYQQFLDILSAYKSPEGAYQIDFTKREKDNGVSTT